MKAAPSAIKILVPGLPPGERDAAEAPKGSVSHELCTHGVDRQAG